MQELKDCRILVVEDDTLVAWDIEAMLQDAGGTVVGPVGKLAQAQALIAKGIRHRAARSQSRPRQFSTGRRPA